jgi:hypothetical protein
LHAQVAIAGSKIALVVARESYQLQMQNLAGMYSAELESEKLMHSKHPVLRKWCEGSASHSC